MSNIKKINVTLAGHVDHGKSTLIEAITGKFPDSHKFEIEKNMTVFLKVISFRYDKKTVINFLDTPGHSDFRAAVNVALAASDAVILVVSAVKGFQARSEYIIRQALKQKKQIIIAATKMDLPTANVGRIRSWLQEKGINNLPIVPVSAKEGIGISDLLEAITTQLKIRRRYKAPPKIFVLGVKILRGIGEAYLVLIKKGTLLRGMKLAEKFDVRNIYSLSLKRVNKATAGEYVYIVLSNKEQAILDTGTILTIDKMFKIDEVDEGVYTTRSYKIRIHKPQQFHEAERILHALANDTLGMSVTRSNDLLEVSVVGNLQFELAKEKLLERNIEFAVEEERENEIITIANRVKIKTKKAEIELIPRSRKGVVVERYGGSLQDFDAIGVVTAAEALKVQGLYAIVKEGTTADDIAEAVAKGIEKAGLIKIVQNKSILIKSNYPNKIAEVATEFGGTITSISKDSILVLIPVSSLDDFINKALHSTKGFVEINLIKIEHNERILAIDPGMRHIGFAYIEGDEIPELWTINLDWPLDA
ncbi:MAG: translation elongation factor EF1A family protein, partial [Candidatus Asgardarchaeia archaeon]